MNTTRRGFLASLMALPVVARSLAKLRAQSRRGCQASIAYGASIVPCKGPPGHTTSHMTEALEDGGRTLILCWPNEAAPQEMIYFSGPVSVTIP